MNRADTEAETEAIKARYAKRAAVDDRYSILRPDVYLALQERQRVLLRFLAQPGVGEMRDLTLLEVGCGAGGNLLELLRLGFSPAHLQGLELLPERFEQARACLPSSTRLWLGDASQAPVAPSSQDLVLQSTVFSSLLDDAFQAQLAQRMWAWLKPGGAVIWYDFTVNNPRNRDVRGVPLQRVRELFPHAHISSRRVTLAPPLARALCRVHPLLYGVFNRLPLLRTHRLVWLHKPTYTAAIKQPR
jgi:SAM-dependent methyltransferase